MYYWSSIGLIVISNIVYNICQKEINPDVNPFASLFITYVIAGTVTLVSIPFYGDDSFGFVKAFSGINWATIVLALGVLGIEIGYLLAFRAGWDISTCSVIANILLALALIPIGMVMYGEQLNWLKISGFIVCIIGLVMINKN